MEHPAAKYRAKVKLVVADGDRQLCEGLRMALRNEGYQDIRTVGRLSAVRDIMGESMVDLLVLDVDLPDGDAVALVRDIRRGKAGRNPFIPVIFVTWESDTEIIRRAVNSGVDLILIKPLSAARLFARIDQLVADRKPFVVTADYVGPDRRGGPTSATRVSYEVPNTLKDKMEGRAVDLVALSGEIESTMQEMNGRRLEQAALQLGESIDVVCRTFETAFRSDDLDYALAQASHATREIANLGNIELVKLCASLKGMIDAVRADPAANNRKQVDLLKPLAASVMVACKTGLAPNAVVQEISQVLWPTRAETPPDAVLEDEPVLARPR